MEKYRPSGLKYNIKVENKSWFKKGNKEGTKGIKKANKTSFKKGNISPKVWLDKPEGIHPRWKGNKVGYHGVHTWIKKWKGQPETCEGCGKTGLKGRQINWANKDHIYKRILDDYIRLCIKCHRKYDRENN